MARYLYENNRIGWKRRLSEFNNTCQPDTQQKLDTMFQLWNANQSDQCVMSKI